MSSMRILVFGATGRQGGAVVKECLRLLGRESDSKAEIFAVTRNAESRGAKKLQEQGVTLLVGDAEDAKSDALRTAIVAAKPTHVFLMSNEKVGTFFWKGTGCKVELATAERLLDILEQCGSVKHVVMSSVCGADAGQRYGMPNFKVKADIEEQLKQRLKTASWTVLRLVTLMEIFVDKEMGGLSDDGVKGLANTDKLKMWYVSCRDLGVATANVFHDNSAGGQAWNGKVVNCCSQNLTAKQICEAYKKVAYPGNDSKKITYTPVMPPWLMALGCLLPDFVAMHKYWKAVGYPITPDDEKIFREVLKAEPWSIEDYFESLVGTHITRH